MKRLFQFVAVMVYVAFTSAWARVRAWADPVVRQCAAVTIDNV